MVTTHRTVCNRDCPDACRIVVTVNDGRATALRGDRQDPITQGFLCERTNRFLERQYASDRILSPLVRRAGALVEVSWDEALDHVAGALAKYKRESGPSSILHYRSGGSLGLLKHLAELLFERFGPVSLKRGDICSGAGEAAQLRDFGVSESHDVRDLLNSRLIVLWGKNPHVSGPHLLPILNQAKRNGATVVGIDPIMTRLARLSDLFLTPRPGADYPLAMAITRRLFDRGAIDPEAPDYCDNLDAFRELACAHTFAEWTAAADVAAADADRLADLYAETKPAAILIGWGLGRRRNGSRTIRAIDALAAISGNLGVPGGGASYYFGRRTAFDTDFIRGTHAAPRTLSEARLGQELLAADPPVRMIWVTAGNPLSMLPDSDSVRRGFDKAETVVVVDTHPTDTTDHADVVLPTLTLLEDDDLMGAYGNHYLRASTPAIAPPDGPRHELHILQAVAERLGLGDVLAGTIDDWKRRLLARLEKTGVTLAQLASEAVRNPFADEVLFSDRKFPTATGRVNLLFEAAAPPPATDAHYPLTLLTSSTPKAQSSQWAGGPPSGPLEARVHPDAAGDLGDGDRARLVSRMAALEVVVRHDRNVRCDVVLFPKGGMRRDGQCANALIPAIETDDGGGAAYYDEPVCLVPVPAAPS